MIPVLCVLVALAIVGGTVLFQALWRAPDPVPDAAAIVVLSGGATPRRGITPSELRTDAGTAAWSAGRAPLMVVTGGHGDAAHMKARAVADGVPADAVVAEPRAGSTLQNALFTAALPAIDPASPILLVTERFHLPRAWASFRWAGFTDIILLPADPPSARLDHVIAAEAIKWPLNVLRAGAASLLWSLGAPDRMVLPWLT